MSNLFTDAHRRWPVLLVGCVSIAALPGLNACGGKAPPTAAPSTVVAMTVHAQSAGGGAALHYPVEAGARYANAMSFRVAGKLIERGVRLGDTVRHGQVVARLDPADADNQAAAARAAVDAADSRLTLAKQNLERDTAQFAAQLIAENTLQQTRDAFRAAQAGRAQATAQSVVAGHTLQYHTLVADHDGVITSEGADTGQFVAAGQTIFGLAWSGDVDAFLDAAAADAARISVGQEATLSFTALPGRSFAARVREVAPAADPQSRTYRVKLTVTQPNAGLRLGMTGEATIAAATAGAAAPSYQIPTTALFHQGANPAVWVVRAADSTLELRPVTVARFTDRSAIVTAGLTDGERIVSAGVHSVFAGEHVTPVAPLFNDDADVPAAAAPQP